MFASPWNSTSLDTESSLEEDTDEMMVIIEWGKERMQFKLPDPKTPLKALKQAIANKTGIDPSQQTLYMHGFKMKDDNAALERYGLYIPGDGNPTNKPKSSFSNLMRGFTTPWMPKRNPPKHITLVSSPDSHAVVSDRLPTNSSPNTTTTTTAAASSSAAADSANNIRSIPQSSGPSEASILQNIDQVSKDVLTRLTPEIERYSRTKGDQLYRQLSETLLQALLRLDSINVNPEWSEARQARRQGVKDVQAALDRVDTIKEG